MIMGAGRGSGVLIVFEGIDGSGKTSQVRRLAQRLIDLGYHVVTSKEPTDGPYGRRIKLIAAEGREGVTARQELDLFLKDREEHVREVVGPALDAGRIVILDRYYFSSMAYQGALGIDPDLIQRENEAFAPVPDIVVLFEISPKESLGRIVRGRSAGTDQGFEREDYLARVWEIMAGFNAPYVRKVDATGPAHVVTARIWTLVEEVLEGTRPGRDEWM